jgi:putative peptidoglycan lipid II flippase
MSRAKHENKEIGKASKILAASTFLSRILGLVRNQLLSHYFGAGFLADAFIAAFTIPNALRRLLGEGALTPAFVSLFTRQLENEKPGTKAKSFANQSLAWLVLVLLLVTLLGILLSPLLVLIYVPEFQNVPGKFEFTVKLTQFLFPFLILISLSAFCMGILNSLKRFSIPALGPAVLNLSVIIVFPLLILRGDFDPVRSMFVFAGSILFGALLQLLIQIPALIRAGCLPKLERPRADSRVRELSVLLLPSIFGMGVYQLNIIINRVFASEIPGAVSHLFYADLLIELPVSLIATSMAVAAVPSFSRLSASGDKEALGQTFAFSWSINASLAFASMAGILALAGPLISGIFFSGKFQIEDWRISTQCLVFYALGLPFFCLLRSLVPLFYAEKDTKTPVYVAIVAVIINFFGAWQLSKQMGASGIALATSIASASNFFLLLAALIHRHPLFPWKRIASTSLKSSLASLVMFFPIFFAQSYFFENLWSVSGLALNKILVLLLLVTSGGLLFFVFAWLMKLEVSQILTNKILRSHQNKSI